MKQKQTTTMVRKMTLEELVREAQQRRLKKIVKVWRAMK